MSEITHELKQGFEYALKGESQIASFITLREGSIKQLEFITPIKQAVTAAIIQATSRLGDGGGDASDGGDAPDADTMLMLLYQWEGNANTVFMHARELFKHVAMVDGEVPLTKPLIDKMGIADFERLVGEYIANFLAPSLMAGG